MVKTVPLLQGLLELLTSEHTEHIAYKKNNIFNKHFRDILWMSDMYRRCVDSIFTGMH